jgi:hypothetical protein
MSEGTELFIETKKTVEEIKADLEVILQLSAEKGDNDILYKYYNESVYVDIEENIYSDTDLIEIENFDYILHIMVNKVTNYEENLKQCIILSEKIVDVLIQNNYDRLMITHNMEIVIKIYSQNR